MTEKTLPTPSEVAGIRLRPSSVDGYLVSRCGKVWSEHKQDWKSQTVGTTGYYYVSTSVGGRAGAAKVHRLVAQAWVDGEFYGGTVDHLDGDKLNNHFSNLQWVSLKENLQRSFAAGLSKKVVPVLSPVQRLGGGVGVFYPSMTSAGHDGFQSSCISNACAGRLKTYKGYIWSKL